MQYHHILPAIIAISAALTCTACNKKVEINNATEQSWNESEVNSLFKNVPADSPMVIATTRKVDLNHPNHQTWRNKTAQLIQNASDMLNAYPTTILHTKLLNELNVLLQNFGQEAPKYGLNPNHLDAIAYIRNSFIVFQFTVQDGLTFKTALLNKIQSETDFQAHVKISEIPVNATSYSLFEFHDGGRAKIPRFVVKFDPSVITIIPVWNADETFLAQFEQPLTQSFDKSKLGQIDKDTFIKGYIDNARALESILAGDLARMLENGLHKKLSESCYSELVAQFSDYPDTEMDVQIAASGNVALHSSVTIKDADELKKLHNLQSGRPEIVSKNTAAAIQLSMKVKETMDYLFEKADNPSKQFTCPELQSSTQKANRQIRDLRQGYLFIKSMINGISGLSVSMGKPYNLQERSYANFTDSLTIRLDGPKETLGSLLEMVGTFSPAFRSITPTTTGEIIEFNLADSLDIPIKGNALMTDHDLTIATTDQNIRQIAEAKSSPTEDFFKITASSDMIFYIFIEEALRGDDERYISLIDRLVNKTPIQFNLSLGTNQKAGTMNYELNYLY